MSKATTFVFSLFSLLCVITRGAVSQSAHQLYDELYKAGGLDRMADGYACFDDDPNLKTFFIFGESKILKQFFIDQGKFSSLPPKMRAELNKGFLNVRQYDHGVAHSEEIFLMTDGISWVSDPFNIGSGTRGRIRLSIAWQTLRYVKQVEVSQHSYFQNSASRYGHCEEVSPNVQQTGN